MFTRNYYNILKSFLMKAMITNGVTLPNGNSADCTYGGSTGSHLQIAPNINGLYTTQNAGYVTVGSGSTPPTLDDYKVENPLSYIASSGLTTTTDENLSMLKTFGIVNQGTESCTIREVGLWGTSYYKNGNSYTNVVLIYRKVLDEPYTLAPGESGYMTLKFDPPAIPTI